MTSMEPFRIRVPDGALADLQVRLRRTRWPGPETATDWSQGVPLMFLRDLVGHWETDYDWRAVEKRLGALPQFRTVVDGLGIHLVHARSPHPDALPLVLTNGWPGSLVEYLDVVGPLTDPTAYGGDAADAFHVVVPTLPGFGWSDKPTGPGWGVARTASAWAEIMHRLGYARYGLHGTDWGASVATTLAQRRPQDVVGLHLSPPLVAPDPATFGELTPAEREALDALERARQEEDGYTAIQATRPQTIGYSLLDSPVGLCAWIVEKLVTWTDPRGQAETALTRDQMLDDVTLYWLTGTGASAARLYAESIREVQAVFAPESAHDSGPGSGSGVPGGTVEVPTGASVFPAEVPRPSRRWVERRFPDLRWWGEPARGGHFPAWEVPDLFVDELRSFFRLVR